MNPVRWGILGASKHFLTRVLPSMKKTTLSEPYAIASRSIDKAKEVASRTGIPVAYGSYDDLLADEAVEAVFIPLPNNMHLEWIKKAADAGKHVLCEKPITMNAAEAIEAARYAAAKDVMLMEAFMYRFQPRWEHVKELVTTGSIGNVLSVRTFFAYSNSDPKNIRNILEAGGGALYDIGCYAVSTARWIFGREPKRVVSAIERDSGFGTDVLVSAILDFGGGHGEFTVGTKSFQGQRVDVFGTNGSIHVTLPFNTFTDTPSTLTVVSGLGSREVTFEPVDQYAREMDAFSTAVRLNAAVPTPVADAIGNMSVLDALFKSEKTGGWVAVEPVPAI